MADTLHIGGQERPDRARVKARGAFVNTAKASCSIYESGRMVFECIRHSPYYDMSYFSLDALDIGKFHAEGLLHLNDAASIREDETYDFYVFNWHFVTMASDIDPLAIKRLPVPKFTVVLELAPGDPLMLVPREVFDGYMVLDPTAEENGRLVAFPRPLEMDGREGRVFRGAVPTIGSFGFGTPAKGFELLVEAVNREFDKAIVRINIPHGQYVETDIIHRMPYAERVKDVCRQIAKPGIEVSFTNEFLSPTELVQWCTQNDLNCFMYTRALPGLSATTDQCIISGQPLLTLTNDTFRHIHRYIEPYPFQGLRKAIATTGKTVRLIQQEWSKERFQDKFHQMLSDAGIITMPHIEKCVPHIAQTDSIFVISRNSPGADNPFDYARKIANSIGRSRQHQIRHISYESAVETLASLGPSGAAGIVFVDYDLAACIQLDAIVSTLPCRKIIIPRADELRETEYPYTWANVVIIPRLPIIPFHTTSAGLKTPARIVLLGFSANSALLQEIIQKVLGEVPTAEVVVECDAPDPAAVAKKGTAPSGEAQPHVSWAFLKSGDRSLPDYFGESSLIIANNDPARTQELESLISIAMVTERPVVFTRRGVFPQLLGRELYVEDHSIAEIIRMGMAAHIKVLYDFGEWTFATALRRILDESWRPTISPVPDNAIVALSPAQFLQVAALGTGVTVTGHETRVHFRHCGGSRGSRLFSPIAREWARYSFAKADKLRDSKLWAQAAATYRRGLKAAPECFEMWVQYGHAAKEAGDLAAAEHAYGRALAINPKDADLLVQLGHLYRLRSDPVRMQLFYDLARDRGSADAHVRQPSQRAELNIIDTNHADSAAEGRRLFGLGDRLRDAGDWAAAADAYDEGLKKVPQALQYWIQLGNVRKEAGDLIGSERAYVGALDISPADPEVNLQLGHLFAKSGKAEAALSYYSAAINAGSRDSHAIAAISNRKEESEVINKLMSDICATATQPIQLGLVPNYHRAILSFHAAIQHHDNHLRSTVRQ